MKKPRNSKHVAASLALTALFVALMAVCAFLSVPFSPVSFTMQTFAVFLAVYVLGTKRAVAAVTVYIAIGAAGLPVFAGFRGGIGVLAGPTGGYIVGFLFTALLGGVLTERAGGRRILAFLSLLSGLVLCYAFGTAWFALVYASSGGTVSVSFILGAAVLPFIIPDLIKIILAIELGRRLKPVADRIVGGE